LNRVSLDDAFFMDMYDYHNRNWYREIADNISQSYQVVWTRPYVDDSGSFSLMTTAGSGVFDNDGNLIAISTVDWEINEVIKHLINLNPTKNSFVLLCVPEKDYVISSAYTNIYTGDSVKDLPWDIYEDTFTLNNIKYKSFGKYMDNGWLLTIQIPVNEIFEEVEIRNSRYSILIAISSVLMLLIAYLVITRYINNPIKKLTKDVSDIALGNLDKKINIISKDELGLLAKTFNKVTSELKYSIEENVREREEKKRINTELEVANEIQSSMLPNVFPAFPERYEFDLYASMIPAKDVGGDFYDFFLIDNNNLAVVIADVSGKGVPAALFMVISKTLIKNTSYTKKPEEIFKSVNIKLCEGNETGMFVTAFMGIYNIPTGRFLYVNAGHNPPLVKKRSGSYEYLKTDPCIVLAFMEETEYKHEEINLGPGDILYLYTDGVTEAMNNNNELFGEERLRNALNQCEDNNPKDILLNIKQRVDDFAGEEEQTDDITMLALKITEKNEQRTDNSEQRTDEKQNNESIIKIDIEAKLENLNIVFDFINNELEKIGYNTDLINKIEIAVEEIFTNIVKYAYEDKNGRTIISISTEGKTRINFEDTGKPYNPVEQKPPDLEKDLENREIGGLGVYIVKNIMDSIEYSRQNNKNTLTITKNHPII
ncbi:MAG: SpoIIE family protein phosphatase, partial [Treponema sp.]|nr:SpoIIE family protein phosphatase [Treponema sp.]